MSENPISDWDPLSDDMQCDQRKVYDLMRAHCPVAYSEVHQWSLFRHEDVMHALSHHVTFSSSVSRYPAVPNGMDPPEHAVYRNLVNAYFQEDHLKRFEPQCYQIVGEIIAGLEPDVQFDFVGSVALPFAAASQCRFMGWSPDAQNTLVAWSLRNHQAVREGDRVQIASLAKEFEQFVTTMIHYSERPDAQTQLSVTARLLKERVFGKRLTHRQIASIVRNWTVGEVGTLSASVGILVEYLARHRWLQDTVRHNMALLPEAIEEILRLNGPLVANRRTVTQKTTLHDRTLRAGDKVQLNWIAANRDPAVFEHADAFRFGRDHTHNLLYGYGIHACPGASLARKELAIIVGEVLRYTDEIVLADNEPPTLATYPTSGFSRLPIIVR